MDLRQTREYGEYLKKRGWIVEKVKGVAVFIKKMPLLPIHMMKLQRWEGEVDLGRIEEIKRQYRVFYSVLEPKDERDLGKLKKAGYRLSGGPYLPTETVVVDLGKSKEELWRGLKKDGRQWIKRNEEVEIRELKGREIERFWRTWKKWGKGYIPSPEVFNHLLSAFGSKGRVVVAEEKGKLMAGVVIMDSSDSTFYYYAWTSEEGRRRGVQYRLVWEEMLAAKRRGKKWWDFEGVEDKRWERKSWQGFSLFKKKFGGEEISFPGSYQKWF